MMYIVEPNQHDDVPVVPEPIMEDEDEDPKEEEIEEEEDPQEEEDDMEVDIKEDENEPKLTYPYEETDSLNPPPPASESEPDDVIKVENPIEAEDETVPASVYEVGESSTAAIPREDGDSLLHGFMRRDIDSLFGRMVDFSRQLCGHETVHALVEKKGKAKDKFYGKLILDLGNEVRSSVEEGTTAMERLVEKLSNVEEKAECKRLKKELEEARNDASGFGPVRGQYTAPVVRECTFAGFMKCNPTVFCGVKRAVKLRRWLRKLRVFSRSVNVQRMKPILMTAEFCPIEKVQRMEHELWNLKVKEYNVVAYTQRFNELDLMCPRMVETERVKVDAYIRGLTDNIKSEVTSSKPANLNEANRQKQGNARAMVTAPTDGKLPLCERCFTRYVSQWTIKCHKCGKVRHKARHCKEKNVATGVNALPILTCYDCGEQGSDRSFVNTRFSSLLDIKPIEIEDSYEVELVDGRLIFLSSWRMYPNTLTHLDLDL
ncbi:putative reverse transcriptase domain-containing protein [Tanacetum coccineum]